MRERLTEEQKLEKLRAKWRRSAQKHRVHKYAYRKQWRLRNLESVRAKNRDWQKKNWKHRQAYVKRYYEENQDKLRKRSRDWYKNHQGRHSQSILRRIGRLKGQSIKPETIDAFCKRVKSKSTCVCYYCEKVVSTKGIHFDHIVPLSKGGPHSIENICVSCAKCNLSKHATPIQDWYKLGQQILSL